MIFSNADLRLLDALQRDVTSSQDELADMAGMSRTSAWRRIREFEKNGVLASVDRDNSIIPEISLSKYQSLKTAGVISAAAGWGRE